MATARAAMAPTPAAQFVQLLRGWRPLRHPAPRRRKGRQKKQAKARGLVRAMGTEAFVSRRRPDFLQAVASRRMFYETGAAAIGLACQPSSHSARLQRSV